MDNSSFAGKQRNAPKKSNPATIVVVLMVVAILGGLAAYFLMGNKNLNNKTPEGTWKVFVEAVNTKNYDRMLDSAAVGAGQTHLIDLYRTAWNKDFSGIGITYTYSNFTVVQSNGNKFSVNVKMSITKNGITKNFSSKYNNVKLIQINNDWLIEYDSILVIWRDLSDNIKYGFEE